MKKISFILLLFIWGSIGNKLHSQNAVIDSLKNLIANTENDTTKVKLLNTLALRYYATNPEKIKETAQEALNLAEKSNFVKGAAESNRVLGIHFHVKGAYNEALQYYLKSLPLWEKCKDDKGKANTLNNVGAIYGNLNNYDLSLKYYLEAVEIAEKINNDVIKSKLHNNIGTIYELRKKYDEAISSYNKSLEIKRKLEDFRGIAYSISNIGVILNKQGKYEAALKSFTEALPNMKKINDTRGEVVIYSNMGESYFKLHKFKKANIFLQKAAQKMGQAGDKLLEAEIHLRISKLDSATSNYQGAYKHFRRHSSIQDSLFSISKSQQIAEMQSKYNTEKQETENKLLKATISQQKMTVYAVVAILISVVVALFFMLFGRAKLKKANREISKQKLQTEIAHENIKSGINYASRIQTAMLPAKDLFRENFSEYFIFFKPRDVVSGDFYYAKKINDLLIFAAADCTGHGVPGAFVSMLGISLLNEIVKKKEIKCPNQALDELREEVKNSLHQTGNSNEQKDGMDIALCVLNTKTKNLQFSGAYNSLYVILNQSADNQRINELEKNPKIKIHRQNISSSGSLLPEVEQKLLIEVKADPQPIGIHKKETAFTAENIQLEKGDALYLLSDGFVDQFGHKTGRKYMKRSFIQLLLAASDKPMIKQKEILNSTFQNWRGDTRQIDDVLVMGLRI